MKKNESYGTATAQNPSLPDLRQFISRINRIKSSLNKKEAYYVAGESDIFYLSGFSGTFARVIIKEDRAIFMTDKRYEGLLGKIGIDRCFTPVITKNYKKDIDKILSGSKNIYLTGSTPLNDYLYLQKKRIPLTFSGLIASLRMIKDAGEIDKIVKAARINEKAIKHLVKKLKPGITESDLSAEFEYFIKRNGAQGTSFSSIIAFDDNAAIPHSIVSDRKLKKGSLILLDTGVKNQGYCSDLTRVVGFGIIDTRLKGILRNYNIVRKAKEIGISHYIDGGMIKKAETEARKFLTEHKLEKYFTHSLGHSLGIDIHEPPSVNKKEPGRFEKGMILTCEPGVYFPGRYGIRIEDDYLITEKGAVRLNETDDALILA